MAGMSQNKQIKQGKLVDGLINNKINKKVRCLGNHLDVRDKHPLALLPAIWYRTCTCRELNNKNILHHGLERDYRSIWSHAFKDGNATYRLKLFFSIF